MLYTNRLSICLQTMVEWIMLPCHNFHAKNAKFLETETVL